MKSRFSTSYPCAWTAGFKPRRTGCIGSPSANVTQNACNAATAMQDDAFTRGCALRNVLGRELADAIRHNAEELAVNGRLVVEQYAFMNVSSGVIKLNDDSQDYLNGCMVRAS
eukprot:1140532-Pelagomonas_calceolata.AAC.9